MQKYSLKTIPATKNHNFEQGKCLATQKEGRRKRREGRGEREEERVQRRGREGGEERRGKREEGRVQSEGCRVERRARPKLQFSHKAATPWSQSLLAQEF